MLASSLLNYGSIGTAVVVLVAADVGTGIVSQIFFARLALKCRSLLVAGVQSVMVIL